MNFTHIANPVRVRATRIVEVTDVTDRSEGRGQSHPDVLLRLEDGSNFTADSAMTSRHVPVPDDYLVMQEDGYVYLNPKGVFERKYSPLDALPASATPTENPAAAAVKWKPTMGRIVVVKGYITNGSDEHPGIITRVHGAGEGAFVNVLAFPDLQSNKIFSSIPVYSSRAAADADVAGYTRRQNGFAFFPDRG
ncbi:hypothetical protein ACUXAV_000325 [Cupriavidus metallidurans]|uniref:hypothetical protein n=1 Tax=Cupriavidus metallidurans TaxID=119219 RepID=UPI00068E5032|nr:hypothetical protein [Cupriavidus metallidurans]MDE4918286.1 hypothetical protein [Cupriavidus metallidurans]